MAMPIWGRHREKNWGKSTDAERNIGLLLAGRIIQQIIFDWNAA